MSEIALSPPGGVRSTPRRAEDDLWGDTVNRASRIESSGLPGEIHVTGRVRETLDSTFRFRCRGAVEIKGKGSMTTYLLDGPSG